MVRENRQPFNKGTGAVNDELIFFEAIIKGRGPTREELKAGSSPAIPTIC